ATLVVSTITINSAFAQSHKEPQLKTIYHVYVNDEFLGTVTNRDHVERLVQEKIERVKTAHQDKDLTYITDELSIIPEQIFRDISLDEQKVLAEIEDEIDIFVESVALKINGKPVLYLENVEKAEE